MRRPAWETAAGDSWAELFAVLVFGVMCGGAFALVMP